MNAEPPFADAAQLHRERELTAYPLRGEVVEPGGHPAARAGEQLQRERCPQGAVEGVVDRRAGARAPVGGEGLGQRDHLEPVAEVEIPRHDRAHRIESRRGQHHQPRPHPRLISDPDPHRVLGRKRRPREKGPCHRRRDQPRSQGDGLGVKRKLIWR